MDNETQERVIPASYAEYKSADSQPKEDKAPEPATEKQPPQEATPSSAEKREPEKDPAPAAEKQPQEEKVKSAPKGETAEPTDGRKQDIQEKDKKEPPKRDRTAKGRVQELLAEGRLDEAEKILSAAAGKTHADKVDQLEKELQEFRTRKPAEPAKPEPVVVAPVAKPAEDPRPSLKAITQKAAEGQEPYAGKEYEELQDMWSTELEAWNEREAERKVAARKAKAEAEETSKRQATEAERQQARDRNFQTAVNTAKGKYSDFDQVIDSAVKAFPNLGNDGLKAAFGAAKDPGELMYALGKDNGAEYGRIARLPADEAFREALYLDFQISRPADPASPANELAAAPPAAPSAPPEKPRPAVSKAPAPYKRVDGFEDPVAARPTSYKAYKAADDKDTARPRA